MPLTRSRKKQRKYKDTCEKLAKELNQIILWREDAFDGTYDPRYHKTFSLPPDLEDGMDSILEAVNIGDFLKYLKCKKSKLITQDKTALLIHLVMYLIHIEKWEDIKYICGKVKFREDGTVLLDEEDHYWYPVEIGILRYLTWQRAPLDLFLPLLEKLPSETMKENSGLFTVFTRLSKRQYGDENINELKAIYHVILSADPFCLHKSLGTSWFYSRYPNYFAASISAMNITLGLELMHKIPLIFEARRWRAICEVNENILSIPREVFATGILPLIPNIGYDLLDAHSYRSNYSYLNEFFEGILQRRHLAEVRRFKKDIEQFIKLLLDFLPISVLVYEDGPFDDMSALDFIDVIDHIIFDDEADFTLNFMLNDISNPEE